MLTVETSTRVSGGGDMLMVVAEMMWFGRFSTVEEAHAELVRRHPHYRDLDLPSPHRAELVIAVDGVPTSFDTFVESPEWVSRAQVGPNFLTLVGDPFDPADVAIVQITDVQPYIIGTRRFYAKSP